MTRLLIAGAAVLWFAFGGPLAELQQAAAMIQQAVAAIP